MIMNNQPLFSIVISVEDNQQHVISAIKSIYNQDYPNIEVLVLFCNPDLYEEPLITELAMLPIARHIRVVVDKVNELVCRSEAIKSRYKKVNGQYVAFLNSCSILRSPKVVSSVCHFFQSTSDTIDAVILPESLESAVMSGSPLFTLFENLLHDRAPNAMVFNTKVIKSYLQENMPVYELFPEYLGLKLLSNCGKIEGFANKDAVIFQKSAAGNALTLHYYRYDTIALSRLYCVHIQPICSEYYYENAVEKISEKFNYYCAYYQVVELETPEEIQRVANAWYRNELTYLRGNYRSQWTTDVLPKSFFGRIIDKGRSFFDYYASKIQEKRFQIVLILILFYNLLLLKIYFYPDFLQTIFWISSIVLALCTLIFVLFQLGIFYKDLKKVKKWLKS